MDGSSYMPAGATPYVPEGATRLDNSLSSIERTGSGIAHGLGLGAIPSGISALTELPNEVGAVVGKLTGNQSLVNNYKQSLQNDPLANQSMVQAINQGNPMGVAQEVSGDSGVSGMNSAMGYADLPGIVKSTAPLLTKTGVAKALGRAYEAATQAGSKISVNDILTEAKSSTLSNELKKGIEDFFKKNYTNTELQRVGPYKFVSQTTKDFTPTKAWKISKDISQHYGPSIFDWFTGTSEQKQAAKAVRDAISTLLKDTSPEAKNLNKLYSIYSKGGKFGGSPAQIAAKYGIPAILNALIGNPAGHLLGGIIGHTTNSGQ